MLQLTDQQRENKRKVRMLFSFARNNPKTHKLLTDIQIEHDLDGLETEKFFVVTLAEYTKDFGTAYFWKPITTVKLRYNE